MSDQLHHLTLTTGHMAVTARSDVSRHTIDHLLPVIDARSAEIKPLDGVYFDSQRAPFAEDPPAGARYFRIFMQSDGDERGPEVHCMACWDIAVEAWAWGRATMAYEAHRKDVRGMWTQPPPLFPPKLPWLAVWFGADVQKFGQTNIGLLGDLERCLFWAMVEAEGRA